MLYNFYELQRSILNPMATFTSLSASALSHPLNPFSHTPLARQMAASYDLMYRLGKYYHKPEWDLPYTLMRKKKVEVTKEVVIKKPFCELIHFKRAVSKRRKPDPKVLVVAPLSGHHATLLRDTVKSLLPKHEVYVTDWVDANLVPLSEGGFGLEDYIKYIQEFIRYIGSDGHVIAVCQPTVPDLAAISLMSENQDLCTPKSMVLMGGPIDARITPTQVTELAKEKPYSWFEDRLISRVPKRFPGAGRQVYPGFMQLASFVAMNPESHAQSYLEYYLGVLEGNSKVEARHRDFYDNYNSVLDLPAEFYLDTIKHVFQEFSLAKGTLEVGGQVVKPSAIKDVALFTIEGEFDDISGQGQTHAAQDLCSSLTDQKKKRYTVPGCGHYGIFSGSKWRELVYPKIDKFIRDNN